MLNLLKWQSGSFFFLPLESAAEHFYANQAPLPRIQYGPLVAQLAHTAKKSSIFKLLPHHVAHWACSVESTPMMPRSRKWCIRMHQSTSTRWDTATRTTPQHQVGNKLFLGEFFGLSKKIKVKIFNLNIYYKLCFRSQESSQPFYRRFFLYCGLWGWDFRPRVATGPDWLAAILAAWYPVLII